LFLLNLAPNYATRLSVTQQSAVSCTSTETRVCQPMSVSDWPVVCRQCRQLQRTVFLKEQKLLEFPGTSVSGARVYGTWHHCFTSSLGERCELYSPGFLAEPRPPKGFPLFSAS